MLADIGEQPVIFVGGTGLYFRALTDGLSDVPAVPEAVRAAVRSEAEGRATAELHADLKARDPETAARLKPSDRQRTLRALEVMASTGRPLVSFLGARAAPAFRGGEWAGLYLAPDRAALGQRIDARFDAMLARGALDEVAGLMQRRLDPALPVMRAHGVPHLIGHLEGRLTLEDAAKRSKLDTRHYAKRQFTWARHQLAGFKWVAPDEAVDEGRGRSNKRATAWRSRIPSTRTCSPSSRSRGRIADTRRISRGIRASRSRSWRKSPGTS